MTDPDPDPGPGPDPGSDPEVDHTGNPPGKRVTPARTGRAAAVIALCAVLGAALAAVAAGLTWWAEDFVDPLAGPVTITASGSSVVPELVPVALVALAGLGAALASHGVLRRIVGAVLLLGGALIAVRCCLAWGSAPASLVQDLPRPADSVGAARLSPLGPLLGIVGGLLIAAAGGLIVAGRGARRMSSRYEPPRSADTAARPE
ncbi:MAG TPA: Trp biosynthesis-associated membrane protein, partial [Nakamurella sp.]|nr:Trp biosynthesis-associated membrane protein [Nakamurella sp.]